MWRCLCVLSKVTPRHCLTRYVAVFDKKASNVHQVNSCILALLSSAYCTTALNGRERGFRTQNKVQLDAALAYLAKLGAQPLDSAALEEAAGVGVVVCACLWLPSRTPCQLANASKCWGCMRANVALHTP